MMLRHIEPGTPEWQDALGEDAAFERLTPEEIVRLRRLISLEEATMGMPSVRWPVPERRKRPWRAAMRQP